MRIAATEEMFTVQTGPYGLAEVHFTPQTPTLRLGIEARTPDGATAQRTFDFAGEARKGACCSVPMRRSIAWATRCA